MDARALEPVTDRVVGDGTGHDDIGQRLRLLRNALEIGFAAGHAAADDGESVAGKAARQLEGDVRPLHVAEIAHHNTSMSLLRAAAGLAASTAMSRISLCTP